MSSAGVAAAAAGGGVAAVVAKEAAAFVTCVEHWLHFGKSKTPN